jgi:rhamnogalacturonan endolyase
MPLKRIILLAGFLPLAAPAAGTPVTVASNETSFVISNAQITAVVNKKTGNLTSLKFHNLEMLGNGSGIHAGYWEQNTGNAAQIIPSISIDPASNSGERGEVSVKGISGGKPLGGGGPGGGMLCDLEIRYALGRDDSGLYTYAIFSHPAAYPRTQVGESRFAAKLNSAVFDWLSIDAKRNKLMATGADWDHGALLNMKEARRLTTGVYQGQVEHKYDYSAVQFNIPAFGWSSTKEHIGLYFINPSMEYLSGGATHVELTGHLDNGDGADPTLLDYWRGTHYGGTNLPLAEGEEWNKVVGPIYIYLNSGATPEAMFADALTQAATQSALWPYSWVQAPGYVPKTERATVSGQLIIQDPAARTLPNLLVGLAHPDSARETWQNDAKHYQFWIRGSADGRFRIPNVRPGTYELHAIADGVLGEFAKTSISVIAGQTLDLGKLDWKPVRYGPQLWEIGIPNRSGEEFFKGDDYFHWGWYLEYAKLFPDDVTYTIGSSDYRKKWFFEQVPHATADDPTGRGNGRATTWTVNFDLKDVPRGRATLRLALAGVSARRIDVAVNGSPAGVADGLVYNATINRDGIQGAWVEKDITFDAALLKPGANALQLTIPAGPVTSGIIYDYLRLEAGAPQ